MQLDSNFWSLCKMSYYAWKCRCPSAKVRGNSSFTSYKAANNRTGLQSVFPAFFIIIKIKFENNLIENWIFRRKWILGMNILTNLISVIKIDMNFYCVCTLTNVCQFGLGSLFFLFIFVIERLRLEALRWKERHLRPSELWFSVFRNLIMTFRFVVRHQSYMVFRGKFQKSIRFSEKMPLD